MRIVNKKRFVLSCIFFISLMLIFGKILFSISKNKASTNCIKQVASAHKSEETKNQPLIILDAGHGGVDRGTNLKNLNEKDLTLKIVKYMESYLKNKGYKVLLTRDKDELIELQEIGNIANTSYADLLVSIHINSIPDINFNGITTLYYDLNGFQKDKRIELAETLQKEAVKSDNWQSKGIKKQNVAILRYSKIPCALVECGFITNLEDRKRLQNEEVLKRLAENISNGITKYLDNKNTSGYNYNGN